MVSFGSFCKKITRYFKYYLFGLVFISLVRAVLNNALPSIITKIVDKISIQPDKALLWQQLTLYFWSYIVLSLFLVGLWRAYDFIIANFIPKQKELITLILTRRMMIQSMDFYQKNLSGNLTNKINDVTQHTPDLLVMCADHFCGCFFMLIVVMVNIARIHPLSAIALVVWIIIFLGGSVFFLFKKNHYAAQAAEGRSQVMGLLVDLFSNMASIRLFARSHYECFRLKKTTTQTKNLEQKRDYFFMRLHLFQGMSFCLFETLCLWWLLKGVVNGTITSGSFMLILNLNLQVVDMFWDLGAKVREFWEKKAKLNQALELIYQPSTLQDPHHAIDFVPKGGQIILDKVTFSYKDRTQVFCYPDIKIPMGQKVGLVGRSGAGKSTFVNLLLGLYPVDQGTIYVDGQNIKNLRRSSLWRSIAVIGQDMPLFNRSLIENIRYGRLEASQEEVEQVAREACIHDTIMNLPQGYDTPAGERGGLLSGGQRQRVAIARALLKRAEIFILDEATSQLDALTEGDLLVTVEQALKNKTLLVIAHRLVTVETMDRILVFENGHIVQDGTPQELLVNNGIYRELWKTQRGIH